MSLPSLSIMRFSCGLVGIFCGVSYEFYWGEYLGRCLVRRIIKMRMVKSNYNHTFQIKIKILRKMHPLVGASEMRGCGYFLSFLF